MARPERFELPTARFVAEYSIQLSYGRIVCCSRLKPLLHRFVGGEGGIRTLEGLLTLTPLAGERFQPLSHLSDPVFSCANLDTASFGAVGSGSATLLKILLKVSPHQPASPFCTSPADWESALTRGVLPLALRVAPRSKFAPGEFVNHSATSPILLSPVPILTQLRLTQSVVAPSQWLCSC